MAHADQVSTRADTRQNVPVTQWKNFLTGATSVASRSSDPLRSAKRLPVLFWFHGTGGDASHCDTNPMADFAKSNGFALVCGEAVNGLWQIPEIITDATGTPCKTSDSYDMAYIEAAIGILKASGTYDTSRVFTSGCSLGSAFSIYSSQCLKARTPDSISAFATHSTGLKVKGDGNHFPPDEYNPQYSWGECPGCQYFPARPSAFHDELGLKGCIFDNFEDPIWNNPLFYHSSRALEHVWTNFSMKTEAHYMRGGHCKNIPYADIVNCLDDRSGRLLSSGPLRASMRDDLMDAPVLVV